MSVRMIAKQAGVSPTTVSLALHNSPLLPDATKRRVRACAEKIGYRPNAKLVALMSQLRVSRIRGAEACFGIVSLYDTPHPWEQSSQWTRLYEAMQKRADEIGYRLEPIWLRAPGMTYRRARTIISTRGIQGLLCFGSPELEDEFPGEFRPYAIVTLGQSIRTPLHRVIRHYFSDVWSTLERVHAMGYRRPGLVLGNYDDVRSGHACAGAYLGWCEHRLGPAAAVPILRIDQVAGSPLLSWLKNHRPDVIVYVHLPKTLPELEAFFRANKIRVPNDLGVAAVSQIIEHTRFSGKQENLRLMGVLAVELLASRIVNLDFGFPVHPRIEMVESEWIDGRSL
ncbi:MAG: LacI family DNA-binding transcriptional regulator [Opitutales bacterium]